MPTLQVGGGYELSRERLHRWMLFVDGENLTFQGQKLAKEKDVSLPESKQHIRDVYLWPKDSPHTPFWRLTWLHTDMLPTRAYYYTSYVGSAETYDTISRTLWDIGFTPKIFQKKKQQVKSKGVDIALATDMLTHGFHDHYDVAFLVAGDGDYLPLINEVKRMGKIVVVAFFGQEGLGLSEKLKLACDHFLPLDRAFADYLAKP